MADILLALRNSCNICQIVLKNADSFKIQAAKLLPLPDTLKVQPGDLLSRVGQLDAPP